MWGGVWAYVYEGVYSFVIDDEVIFESTVCTLFEFWVLCFLKDSEYPFIREDDGIVVDMATLCSCPGDWSGGAYESVARDCDILCFVIIEFGAEELEAGTAANVDGTVAGVFEKTFFDDHLFGSAFHLDGVRLGEFLFAYEGALGDRALMAAYHVDAGAAPAFEAAIFYGEVIHSGHFQGVVIAIGAGVLDGDVFEGYVVCGRVESAAVIDVDAIEGEACCFNVCKMNPGAIYQMDRLGTAA